MIHGVEEPFEALRSLGIEPEAIERAERRGQPEEAIFHSVVLPAMAERTVSAADIEAQGGLPTADVLTMFESFGLPPPEPDQPAFTPQEAEVFVKLKRLEEIWPPDVALQAARVYGRLLARIAQTELQLFRVYVAPRLLAEGRERVAALHMLRDALESLIPLSDPLLVGVHRRWVEYELAQEAVTAVEADSGDGGLPGAVDVTFLFCDLKDFTAFADSEGDIAAVMAIDRFGDTVIRERGAEFRFMKALGDGFMLAYGDAGPAVGAGARIIEAMQVPHLPRVHASVHRGVAILREGDYFGSAVNLAARLLNAAGRDELMATDAVVESCGEEFRWEPRGKRRIRGVSEPVAVHRLAGYS
jgi:adenylate cyclase